MADMQAELARYEAELAQMGQRGTPRPQGPPGPGSNAARPGFQGQAPGFPSPQPWSAAHPSGPPRMPGPPQTFNAAQRPAMSYPAARPSAPQTMPSGPRPAFPGGPAGPSQPQQHPGYQHPGSTSYSSAAPGGYAGLQQPSFSQAPPTAYSQPQAAYPAAPLRPPAYPAAPAYAGVAAQAGPSYAGAPQQSPQPKATYSAPAQKPQYSAKPQTNAEANEADDMRELEMLANGTDLTEGHQDAAAQPQQVAEPAVAQPQAQTAATHAAALIQSGKRAELYTNIQEAFKSQKASKKPKYGVAREAAGKKWIDPNLLDWPENDFRIFVGDIGNETNDEVLTKAFQKYPAFNKARVVRDKKSNKTKGFGFVSFSDPIEGAKALREMDGKYIGNRPCKLKKSSWTERNQEEQRYVPGKKKNHILGGGIVKKSGLLHR